MRGFGPARRPAQVAAELVEAAAFLGRDHDRRGDRLLSAWPNRYETGQTQSEARAADRRR